MAINWTEAQIEEVVAAVLKGINGGVTTVKNEWDAAEKLDTKLLGITYHETPYKNLKARLLRKKKRLLAGAPGVSFGFSETIKKIRTNLVYYREKVP